MNRLQIFIDKTTGGYTVLSAVVCGQWVHRHYMDYSLRECDRRFKAYCLEVVRELT